MWGLLFCEVVSVLVTALFFSHYIIIIISLFCLFRATPGVCGGSQARGLIGAVAAGVPQSHSNASSEPRL